MFSLQKMSIVLSFWILAIVIFGGVWVRVSGCSVSTSGTYIVVEKGAGPYEVACLLGVSDSYLLSYFVVGVLFFHKCHWGAYSTKTPIMHDRTFSHILSDICHNKQMLFPVRVLPEQADVDTIADLNKRSYLISLPQDKTHMFKNGFAPETYYVRWGTSVEHILTLSEKLLEKWVDDLWEHRGKAVKHLSKKQLVVLASIVAKETWIKEEYTRVASVFLKRLGKDLSGRLYACSTVLYAAKQKGMSKNKLLFDDLYIKDANNTYRHSGLPKFVIANPPYNVLKAVMQMNHLTQDLYFLFDPQKKRHIFTTSFEEHLKHKKIIKKSNNS